MPLPIRAIPILPVATLAELIVQIGDYRMGNITVINKKQRGTFSNASIYVVPRERRNKMNILFMILILLVISLFNPIIYHPLTPLLILVVLGVIYLVKKLKGEGK